MTSVLAHLRPAAVSHWRFFRRYKVLRIREVAGLLGLSSLATLAETGGMAMILPLLSFVEHGRDEAAFAKGSRLTAWVAEFYGTLGIPLSLATLSIAVFAFIVARQGINYLNALRIEATKWNIGRRLSLRLFDAVLNSRAAHIRSLTTGQVSVACDYEVQASAALIRVYTSLWTQAITFVLYATLMFIAAPQASMMACSVALISGILFSFVQRKVRRLSTHGYNLRRNSADFVTERFRAWKLIKLGNALGTEMAVAKRIANGVVANQIHLQRLTGISMLIYVPVMVGFMLAMLYVFVEVLRHDVATVVLFIAVMLRFTPVTQAVQKQITMMNQFAPSVDGVDKLLHEAYQNAEISNKGDACPPLEHGIQFDNVSFTYPNRTEPALSGISLFIPARKFTALIGKSGSGKSTLADMVARLIEPDAGRILFDGMPIDAMSLRSLRDRVALVAQDAHLLNSSIADNIRYLRPEASDAEVEAVAKLANAHDFIQALPDGYQTVVSDTMSNLSGGQRQRIALARAFLKNADILILDEPTSALDSESERLIQKSIEGLIATGRTTVIVIAHRLTTVRNADMVVRIQDGHLVACGSATDILAEVEREFDQFEELTVPQDETASIPDRA